jgi:hypothetical protein
MVSFLIGLACVANLAAQAEVTGDQCPLGGRLTAIQSQSITVTLNDKITIIPIAPGAEIWRRGADLDSIDQLVIGDQIFLKCTRPGEDSPVMAPVVAAPEQGDGVQLVPHHITAFSACLGRLIAIGQDTLSVKNDDGICVLHTNAQTTFWRGETYPDASAFKLGDEVGAGVTVGYPGRILTARYVEANVAKVEGAVVAAKSDRIVVKDFRSNEKVRVLRDARIRIEQGSGWPVKGAEVMVTGLDLGHNTIRASRLWVEK